MYYCYTQTSLKKSINWHLSASCSALAVLASGSGVSSERDAFMGLVKEEIERLNGEMSTRGSVSMVFHQGGVTVQNIPYALILSSSVLKTFNMIAML